MGYGGGGQGGRYWGKRKVQPRRSSHQIWGGPNVKWLEGGPRKEKPVSVT